MIISEGGFIVKTLTTPEEFEAAASLRHDVFCDELKWVPPAPGGLEVDAYDNPNSSYIGVFDAKRRLLGHARLIPSPYPFMVEKEFSCLMPKEKLEKPQDLAEITRLCVSDESRAYHDLAINISHLVYKGIYQWSLYNGTNRLIMVVESKYYRLLRLNGFPVRAINGYSVMPDGVKAMAITLDWREFEEFAGERKPGFLSWMSRLPVPYQAQSPRHGLYLQH